MSYCRFGPDSDVYIYVVHWATGGQRYLACSGCKLAAHWTLPVTFWLRPGEMLAHLQAHRDAGHQVPEMAVVRLKAEAAGE